MCLAKKVKCWFAYRQGEMVYEVTGVYPAPSFFGLEVEDNGNVKVSIIRDLLTDSLQLTLYQVGRTEA